MSRLFEAYRAIHEQAFMPIFTENGTDSRQLVEACVDEGISGKTTNRSAFQWLMCGIELGRIATVMFTE